MAYLAKLEWGSRKLDLNDSTFSLGDGFVPPSTDYNLNIAEGTSTNINAGGEVVGMRALDRDWSLSVRILGASDAETHQAARQLRAFLSLAHDNRNTLYFCYKPNDDYDFGPLWGQYGSFLRYEVKHADAPVGQQYSQGSSASPIYTRALIVNVNMLIGPYALGKKQRLGRASGCIIEDWISTQDGLSRGLIVSPSATNLWVNPIFGNSTYNTGYTAGGDLSVVENTNPEFVLFGNSSAKISMIADAASKQLYDTHTLAVAVYILSCYIKLPDSSIPTATDFTLVFDGASQAPDEFISCGDGWYRVVYSGTASADPTNYGIKVNNYKTCYVDGFHLEQGNDIWPLIHGDMLGCTWDGTVHGGTTGTDESSATAGVLSIEDADIWSNSEGVIRCVVKMNNNSTEFGGDAFIWDMNLASDMSLYYDDGEDDWRFLGGGTNCLSTGEGAFSVNDIIVFHCVYDPVSGLVLYKNGSSIATNATFTTQASAGRMYIGTTTASGNHIGCTFLDFSTFDRAMTATEVSDDYDNITEWASGGDGLGQRVSEIPWLWTKDGDDVVDNCDDANQDNWALVSGIAGSVPARTLWEIAHNTTPTGYWLLRGTQPQNDFFTPTGNNAGQYYNDFSGTAAVGTTSGDAYYELDITGGDATGSLVVDESRLIDGRTHWFIRMRRKAGGTDTTVDLQPFVNYGTATPYVYGTRKTLTNFDATWRIHYLGSMNISQPTDLEDYSKRISVCFIAYESTDSDIDLDFYMATPSDIMLIAGASGASSYLRISEYNAYGMTAAALARQKLITFGKKIELVPSKLNIVWFIQGADAAAHVVSQTATFNKVFITPRWNLL